MHFFTHLEVFFVIILPTIAFCVVLTAMHYANTRQEKALFAMIKSSKEYLNK